MLEKLQRAKEKYNEVCDQAAKDRVITIHNAKNEFAKTINLLDMEEDRLWCNKVVESSAIQNKIDAFNKLLALEDLARKTEDEAVKPYLMVWRGLLKECA